MSNAQTRDEIAAALSTVEGITGYARRPAASKAGDAWPLWRSGERADGYAYTHTWVIVIVLPGTDEATADAFVDARLDDIDDALRAVLFVDGVAPARLESDGGDILALQITGRTE